MESGDSKCRCGAPAIILGRCESCVAELTGSLRTQADGSPSIPKDASDLRPGQRVGAGRFTLVEEVGSGGMGFVWLAIDESLSGKGAVNWWVALKFIAQEAASDPVAISLLRTEVRSSLRLTHPHIVRVHSWHEHPGEPVFYSMEFAPGKDLRSLLAELPRKRFTQAELEPTVEQLADALAYAHRIGIVHRDLKPANLLVGEDGFLRLADFGLARPATSTDVYATTPGGTPIYASPRQRAGFAPSVDDDLYSLGAVLYHLLVGRPPYSGSDITSGHTLAPPPHPWKANPTTRHDITPEAAATILACLDADSARRPPDVGTFRIWWRTGPPDLEDERARVQQRWAQLARAVCWIIAVGAVAWTASRPVTQATLRKLFSGRTNSTDRVEIESTNEPPPPPPPRTPSNQVDLYVVFSAVQPPAETLRFLVRKASDLDPVADFSVPLVNGEATRALPSGRLVIDAGTGPIRHDGWIRVMVDHRGSNTPVTLDFRPAKTGFSIRPRPFAPVEVYDVWGEPVRSFRINEEANSHQGDYQFSGLVLRPGRYSVRLPFDTTNAFRIEPDTTLAFDVAPEQSATIELPLRSWVTPRLHSVWTNSLGIMLLPFQSDHQFLGARTETNVRQFAAWADSVGLETRSMESVTANGFADVGRSWRAPFNESVNDPSSLPVVGVSREEARLFCKWLSDREFNQGRLASGQEYDLPTSAEWTAMAGKAVYPWGAEWPPNAAEENLGGEELIGQADWPTNWVPVLVASHDPSSIHLASTDRFDGSPATWSRPVDLGGNAAEWCSDVFDPVMNVDPDVRVIPRLSGASVDRGFHLVRGASWADTYPVRGRTSTHWAERSNARNDRTGFRIVLRTASARTVKP